MLVPTPGSVTSRIFGGMGPILFSARLSGQGAGADVRGGHSTGAAPGPTIKTVLNVLERPVNAD
jgi:hypothetical protein